MDDRAASTPKVIIVFALQRALADAVLVGANTVRFEGYRAIDLEPWQLRSEQEGLAPYPVGDHLSECRS